MPAVDYPLLRVAVVLFCVCLQPFSGEKVLQQSKVSTSESLGMEQYHRPLSWLGFGQLPPWDFWRSVGGYAERTIVLVPVSYPTPVEPRQPFLAYSFPSALFADSSDDSDSRRVAIDEPVLGSPEPADVWSYCRTAHHISFVLQIGELLGTVLEANAPTAECRVAEKGAIDQLFLVWCKFWARRLVVGDAGSRILAALDCKLTEYFDDSLAAHPELACDLCLAKLLAAIEIGHQFTVSGKPTLLVAFGYPAFRTDIFGARITAAINYPTTVLENGGGITLATGE